MKTNHENIELIEKWLEVEGLEVQMDDDFIRKVYSEVLEHLYSLHMVESVSKRDRYYRLQYDFVRRDLLKILYKRNNFSAKGIKAGYVYAIGNPAWGDFVKVGSAIDVNDRLGSYQTSSPHRDYFVIDYFCTYDRLEAEKSIHNMFERNSEWCKVGHEEIKDIFRSLKADNNIKVLDDKLYEVRCRKEAEEAQALKEKELRKAEKRKLKSRAARQRKVQRKLINSVNINESLV